jgi:hypothetical protein
LQLFGKHYVRGYGEGSFAEAKLQRLGSISLIASNCDIFSESSRVMERKRYATAAAFRRALEDRLQDIAGKEGVDLQRLRRQVAFDRLLARLFQAALPRALPWVLKGGYAMELRIKAARTTKDIDLTMRSAFYFGREER